MRRGCGSTHEQVSLQIDATSSTHCVSQLVVQQ